MNVTAGKMFFLHFEPKEQSVEKYSGRYQNREFQTGISSLWRGSLSETAV
jgi:hypothetical protein